MNFPTCSVIFHIWLIAWRRWWLMIFLSSLHEGSSRFIWSKRRKGANTECNVIFEKRLLLLCLVHEFNIRKKRSSSLLYEFFILSSGWQDSRRARCQGLGWCPRQTGELSSYMSHVRCLNLMTQVNPFKQQQSVMLVDCVENVAYFLSFRVKRVLLVLKELWGI